MKTILKFSLLLALALAVNLRAATNAVAKFSGTVVDAQDNPVADATVVCYQYPSRMVSGRVEMEGKQHVTTDARGAFEVPAFHGQGVVLVTKGGFAPAWQSWYAGAPDGPQKFVLGASSTLAGVVVDDAGQPVADVEVSVVAAMNKTPTEYGQMSELFGKAAHDLFSARTSADGKFRIENFPADGQAVLLVKKPGKAMRQTANQIRFDELPFHAGQEDITLTLDPAGSVSGKVVLRDSGQPLAHAMVRLEPTTPGMATLLLAEGTVASGADGTFQIPDVPAGSYQLMANFTNEPVADWVADAVPVKVAAGQSVSDLQIQAYKGAVVEVTVRGKNRHELLADANVSVSSEGSGRGGLTGTNGVAYFRVAPGQFTVFASRQNWSQAQTQATVTEGQTVQVTIELGEPTKITGMVHDASGAPVSGATVGVFPNYVNGSTDVKTDANGHYELSWQITSFAGPQNRSYYLLARHLERKLATVQELEETTTNMDVTLKPAMSVTGRVQDTKGKAVTNVMAYVMLHEENVGFTISNQRIPSDEQGRIEMGALPLGERYSLYVSAKGYGNGQQDMDAADPKADHYDFPPLVLKTADRKLAGRVLGTDGKPVAGVNVFMNGQGQPNGNAITDADGRFAFDAVCEGAVSVNASSMDSYGTTGAMGGDTNVVIRFDARTRFVNSNPAASQKLTGTVFDPSGKPAAGARVMVTPSWGAMDNAKADASGEFTINWQAQPGMRNAKYFAVARDVENNLVAMEAIDTNQTRVTLKLAPGLTISGTVQDAKGAPLTRANVNLNMMAGNMGAMVGNQPVKLNADGTFTIPALPMGEQYHLFVSATSFGSANKTIGKNQSQTNSIQLPPFKLKPADLLLAGQVVGTNDEPLSGVQVNINGNGQPNGNTRTDATGHFKFKVCHGPVTIFAYSPSGAAGRVNSANWQAQGGDTNVVVKMGVRQPQRQSVAREIPLKPQPWTLSAIVDWPANHKIGTIMLTTLQAALLLGIAGGIYRFTRKRG